ncbi:MAG: aspartate--tRNA ligase, partial [Acidobacteriaceae bacterium]|nr:aspartate--tRNA ligase [Acidobacteriaceae bacterium]
MAEVTLDFLGDLRRTNGCGELRADDVGKTVVLMGWVHRRRDLGGVIFIHLRDRDGITQLVFDESKNAAAHQRAQELSSEFVIAVKGTVSQRSPDTVNPNISTGEVEVAVEELWILNTSRTPPFPLEDAVDVKEETRLKYRYVDLRRPRMQRNIIMRSKITFA